MKKCLFFFILLLSTAMPAQNKISGSLNPGLSLYNSENSMKTIGDKKIGWMPGFRFAYERENLWGYDFSLEYNYNTAAAEDVLSFIQTGENSPEPINYFKADLILSNNNFDLNICLKKYQYISFWAGPAVSFTNRTIEIDNVLFLNQIRTFKDRLASVCLGVNFQASLEIPLYNSPQYLFFLSGLKFRYVEGVWFDKGMRNLDNYYQNFLTGQINIGVGYKF